MPKLQKEKRHIRAIWKQVLLFGKMCEPVPSGIAKPIKLWFTRLENSKNKLAFIKASIIQFNYDYIGIKAYDDYSDFYTVGVLDFSKPDWMTPFCYFCIAFSIIGSLLMLFILTPYI